MLEMACARLELLRGAKTISFEISIGRCAEEAARILMNVIPDHSKAIKFLNQYSRSERDRFPRPIRCLNVSARPSRFCNVNMARVASVVRFWLLVTVGFEVLALIRSFWLREPIHEVQPMYALVGADMRPERRHFEFITAALLLIRLSSLIRPHSSGAWLTTAVSHIVEAGFFTWLIFGSNPSNRTAKMSLTPWDPKTQGFVIYGIVIANALTFAFTWLCCSPDTLTAAGPKIKRSFGVVILQLWLLCTIGTRKQDRCWPTIQFWPRKCLMTALDSRTPAHPLKTLF